MLIKVYVDLAELARDLRNYGSLSRAHRDDATDEVFRTGGFGVPHTCSYPQQLTKDHI